MATDRTLLKEQQSGALQSVGAVSNGVAAVADSSTRQDTYLKTGAENAATNVAESPCFILNRQGLIKSAKITVPSNVANDTSNIVFFTLSSRLGSAAAATIATYNTATSAQGALTAFVPGSMVVATNANAQLAAGTVVTLTIGKYASGQAVPALSTVTLDVEEN